MGNKEVTIIAGANGSGKTTFAKQYLNIQPQDFLNADEIAIEIAGKNYASAQLKAGKEYFRRLKELKTSSKGFMFESTLSGKSTERILKDLKSDGYNIKIIYLLLENSDVCIARVKERVKAGGHHVPEKDIVRRYNRSRINFWNKYRLLADSWFMYFNSDAHFEEIASGKKKDYEINSQYLFDIFIKGVL